MGQVFVPGRTGSPPCAVVALPEALGFGVWSLEFSVQGSGFRVQGEGFQV